MNVVKNDFLDSKEYDKIIIEFNELDYDIKKSLSKFINCDQKYGTDRSIYLEACNLISCQIDKVTKSFEILSENDIETVINDIKKKQ